MREPEFSDGVQGCHIARDDSDDGIVVVGFLLICLLTGSHDQDSQEEDAIHVWDFPATGERKSSLRFSRLRMTL